MRPVLLATAAAVALTAGHRPARADDAQYAPYPMGGRAVGLGGAFTALADDPSGMFYNPAGLVDVGRSSLQVSTNLYGVELAVGDGVLGAVADALVDLDRVFGELQIIPIAAGGVVGLGELHEDGAHTHAYAVGAFVPDTRTLTVQTSATDAAGAQNAYRRNLTDRTFQAAAAYAYRIDRTWRAGITAAVAYRTLQDQEETSLRVRLPDGRDGFNTAESNIDIAVASLLVTFGLKAHLTDDVTLGLAVTTPSARVWESAAVRLTESLADPTTGASTFQLTDDGDAEGDSRTGTQIRIGLARVFPDWSTFSFDLSFHAPVRYQRIRLTGAGRGLEDDLTLVNDVRRQWVVNAATGYEWTGDEVTWAVGAYTNLSSAPPVVAGTHDADQLPHVNALGASFTAALWGEHTATTLGVTGSYGWGRDVLAQNEALRALGADGFRTVEISQLRVFLFLSSSFMY